MPHSIGEVSGLVDSYVKIIEGVFESGALFKRNWGHMNDSEGFYGALPKIQLLQLFTSEDNVFACCLKKIEAVVYIIESCFIQELVEIV